LALKRWCSAANYTFKTVRNAPRELFEFACWVTDAAERECMFPFSVFIIGARESNARGKSFDDESQFNDDFVSRNSSML
jgi:hypothetical protein